MSETIKDRARAIRAAVRIDGTAREQAADNAACLIVASELMVANIAGPRFPPDAMQDIANAGLLAMKTMIDCHLRAVAMVDSADHN